MKSKLGNRWELVWKCMWWSVLFFPQVNLKLFLVKYCRGQQLKGKFFVGLDHCGVKWCHKTRHLMKNVTAKGQEMSNTELDIAKNAGVIKKFDLTSLACWTQLPRQYYLCKHEITWTTTGTSLFCKRQISCHWSVQYNRIQQLFRNSKKKKKK